MFERIAENRIRDAIERGELDDLPGKGRPLVFEDDSFVPPDLRMAYKILKNAGFLPPELQATRDIQNAIDLLEDLEDEQERYRQVQKLNLLVTKANLMRKRPIALEEQQIYYQKIVERVSVRKKRC
ncbi:MAG: DUF1992 domain-containing protein [Deltaproteobacteria bacterium]